LENEETVDFVYKHTEKTDGATLTILLDEYDELPDELPMDHLLSYIIRHEISPKCNVVTSRSFPCGSLCHLADHRYEILGFTNNERQDYLQKALEAKPNNIETLKQYLDCHPTISSLYCIFR